MGLYYQGDLDADLASLEGLQYVPAIKALLEWWAYGRIQQIATDRSDWHMTHEFDKNNAHLVHSLADGIGVDEFCRVVQILWAEKSRIDGFPMIGALNMAFNKPGQAEKELAEIRARREAAPGHNPQTLH